MGGGDLNMKKSWHPLLMKNQERVWLKEQEALEEKKKLDQLRKELEEERQLQELQRLQEEQTGRKRQEKLEWMYATPATGGGPSAGELEEYLLGKKRVDQILVGDENEKVGASHKNFIAIQNANNARDTAAKIREDPMFAIKQQEQNALKELMSNPLRLKAMKERAGIKDTDNEKDKKSKKKHKHRHHHRHHDDDPESHRRHHRRSSRSRSRTLSNSPPRPSRKEYRDRRSRSPGPRKSDRYPTSPPRRDSRSNQGDRKDSNDDQRSRSRERYPTRDRNEKHHYRPDSGPRRRPSLPRPSSSRPSSSNTMPSSAEDERAARLAAMSQDAVSLESSRQSRLKALEEAEKVEQAVEDAKRMKIGKDGKSSYVREQERILYGGDMKLDERIQRGRIGLVRETE